ncbi:MAG: hypothetical protein MAG431_01814 [Chloroflexi bacterium]|nr:hypothetical protein [Chloroflexota bacterium]
MAKQADTQTTPYEQKVISIMRRLPIEYNVQLVNFAHFLELQTTQDYQELLDENNFQSGDEKWEKLLTKPEAKHIMRKMAMEAREEYQAGKTTDIGSTENGRLKPE